MMLNYEEPQILELMKNTLPSRLYPIPFTINNLRDVIAMAKWVMIKEKIDRQKTDQSYATPFMRVNDCSQSSERSGKKSVTFDVIETFERHNNSIDKLTSLVSKMNVKMDRKETPYKPKVYQSRPRGKVGLNHKLFSPTTDPLAGIEIEEIIIIITEIADPTIEIGLGTTPDMMIEDITIGLMKDIIITDQITEGETIIGKTVETDKTIDIMALDRGMEIGMKVGIEPEIIEVTEPAVGIEVEAEMGKCKIDPELCQMTEEDQGLGLTLE